MSPAPAASIAPSDYSHVVFPGSGGCYLNSIAEKRHNHRWIFVSCRKGFSYQCQGPIAMVPGIHQMRGLWASGVSPVPASAFVKLVAALLRHFPRGRQKTTTQEVAKPTHEPALRLTFNLIKPCMITTYLWYQEIITKVKRFNLSILLKHISRSEPFGSPENVGRKDRPGQCNCPRTT